MNRCMNQETFDIALKQTDRFQFTADFHRETVQPSWMSPLHSARVADRRDSSACRDYVVLAQGECYFVLVQDPCKPSGGCARSSTARSPAMTEAGCALAA